MLLGQAEPINLKHILGLSLAQYQGLWTQPVEILRLLRNVGAETHNPLMTAWSGVV